MSRSSSSTWTILGVLDWTAERFAQQGLDAPRVDAEVLLAHCLAQQRIQLYAHYDQPLAAEELAAYRAAIKRRMAREPVAYITGSREFWSLPLAVTPEVLIPRPETETLVEVALALSQRAARTLVDVGTGSGALAIALASELPAARVLATDLGQAALALARGNATIHGLELELLQGDLLSPLPDDLQPELVVSNPPYVTTAEWQQLPPEVRDWEPRAALDGGPDGLSVIRRLVPAAAGRLAPGGHLALEVGAGQAPQVMELLREQGFTKVRAHPDLAQVERVVSGRR
jgi:release factor glutamine methyltransferase